MPMLHHLWSFTYPASVIMCGRNWLCYFLTQEFISQEFQGKQQRLQEWGKTLDFFFPPWFWRWCYFKDKTQDSWKLSFSCLEGKPCSRSVWGVRGGGDEGLHSQDQVWTPRAPPPPLQLSEWVWSSDSSARSLVFFSTYFVPFNGKEKRASLGLAMPVFVEETGSTRRRCREAALNTLVVFYSFSCSPCPHYLLPRLKTGINNYIVMFR